MSRSKVVNSESFHDGKVVLYQLENRPQKAGSAASRFQMEQGISIAARAPPIFTKPGSSLTTS